MKLPLPARLRALVAKHRTGIPKLLGALTEQTVLKGSTHHGCSALRPQGAGAIAAILKAVHLLAHHISGFTDATAEQVRRLQKRRPNLTKPRTLEMLPRHGLHRLPALKRLRQQIHHAPEALELTHVQDCRVASAHEAAACHQIHQGQLSGGLIGAFHRSRRIRVL